MTTSRACIKTSIVACLLASIPANAADSNNVVMADWETRTAACPPKVTQSSSFTFRVTNVNDLLFDLNSGDSVDYTLRVKGSPVSAVPPSNLFASLQSATQGAASNCDSQKVQALTNALTSIRTSASANPLIAPSKNAAKDISWRQTHDAAILIPGVSDIQQAITSASGGDASCQAFVNAHPDDPVITWVKRVYAAEGTSSSGAPAHSRDFNNVNLEPDQNYQFKLQELWRGGVADTMSWSCGESDIFNLSVGPLITTLPYRTYNQQQVPTSTGTQNELVVSGNTNVNAVGAALINIFPPIPKPNWSTGFAFSVGPVYTLGDAPNVSKLGLFVGGSFHLYRSFFITPGIHIGQFADYPAGFRQGSVIPSGFGGLTPVTRNTAHFAIGITFKTTSFKKTSQQSAGAAPATGAAQSKPQTTSGSSGTGTGSDTTKKSN